MTPVSAQHLVRGFKSFTDAYTDRLLAGGHVHGRLHCVFAVILPDRPLGRSDQVHFFIKADVEFFQVQIPRFSGLYFVIGPMSWPLEQAAGNQTCSDDTGSIIGIGLKPPIPQYVP
jgi:hypothetical protein